MNITDKNENKIKSRRQHKGIKIAAITLVSVLIAAMLTLVCFAYFTTRTYVYTNDGEKKVAKLGMELSLLFDKLDGISNGADLGIVESVTTEGEGDAAITTVNTFKYDSAAEWGSAQNPYIISDMKHLQNLSALQDVGYFYDLYIKTNYTDPADLTTYTANSRNMPYFLICTSTGTPVTVDGEGVVIKPIGNDEFPFIGYVGGAFDKSSVTKVSTSAGELNCDTSVIYNINVQATTSQPDHGLFGSVQHLGSTPDTSGTFTGFASRISDIVLADVRIKVDGSLWGNTIEFFSDHIFSYTSLSDTDKPNVPHETHHVGILAGHLNYTEVENISVYYSSDDITAVDLSDVTNPAGLPFDGEEGANYYSATGIIGYVNGMNPKVSGGTISAGSGSNNSSVSSGNLGGGGKASGTNPGYVLAGHMYSLYALHSTPPLTVSELPLYYYKPSVEKIDIGFMVKVEEDEDGRITYYDEKGRELTEDSSGKWQYATENNDVLIDYPTHFFCRIEKVKIDSDGNVAEAPIYYLEKTLQTKIAQIEYQTQSTVSDLFLFNAKNEQGEKLCVEWMRTPFLGGLLGTTSPSGRYYFYDGVFTFALSSARDAIRRTWQSQTQIPEFRLASEWENGRISTHKYSTRFIPVSGEVSEFTEYAFAFDISYEKTEGETVSTGTNTYLVDMLTGNSNDYGQLTYINIDDIFVGSDEYNKTADEISAIYTNYSRRDKLFGCMQNYNASSQRLINASSVETKLGMKTPGGLSGLFSTATPFAGNSANDEGSWWSSNTYNYNVTISVSNGSYKIKINNRYLAYNTTLNDDGTIASITFALASSDTAENTSFKLYRVVNGDEYIPDGKPGYVPSADANMPEAPIQTEEKFSADRYVLYPTLDSNGETLSYTLIDVQNLGYVEGQGDEAGHGTWLTVPEGTVLDSDDTQYIFDLAEGLPKADATITENTIMGQQDEGNAFIQAPLGDGGTSAYIPLGAIAFKINKDPVDGEKLRIRVIVSVPTSDLEDGLTADEDYYFGLWQYPVDTSTSYTFSKNNIIQKFELPRSVPQINSANQYPVKVTVDSNRNGKHDMGDDQTEYTTYFQGERVLVAYEFQVTEKGVYMLGATNGPMQIAYFSVDGVASVGRDRTGGSHLDSIDFVYDTVGYESATSQKIVTVTDQKLEDDTATEGEDYNYYYPSYCLLFFDNSVQKDNKFVRINQEKINIRRCYDKDVVNTVDETIKTKINFTVVGEETTVNHYIKLLQYARLSDTIKEIYNGVETTG